MGRVVKHFAISIPLLLCIAASAWPRAQGQGEGLIEKMVAVILEHELILESQRLQEPGTGFAVPGMNLGAVVGLWDPDTNSVAFVPSVIIRRLPVLDHSPRTCFYIKIQSISCALHSEGF
jgi:hypothetical protein